MEADFICTNGNVYTMESQGDSVEAFAVYDGKIVAVGSTDEIRALPHCREIDLEGKTVLPGFIDSHLHMLATGEGFLNVDLRNCKSISDVLYLIAAKAKTTPEGEWIRGINFDQEAFAERRMPTRADLDSVTTKHPVLISRYCQHAHVANSMALDKAQINENSVTSTLYKRFPDGRLNGEIWDTAVQPILSVIPDQMASYEAKKEAAYSMCRNMAEYGITSGHTVRGRHVDLDEYLNIYQDLEAEGRLPIRIYASFDEFPALPIRSGLGDAKVKYGYYKIYLDGSLGARSACFTKPYSDAPDVYGSMIHSEQEVEDLVEKANDMGLQIGVHCIGDKAIECVVKAIEKAYSKNPRPNARFRLIHVLGINKELIERCKKLPVMFDVQPKFLASDVRWAEDRLGKERSEYGFAWKKLIDAGFVVSAGSDSPVEPVNPFLGIYAAVTRQGLDGWPRGGWYPENKCSVYEALEMYTKNGAYASFEEKEKGTIAVGKYADFIIVDRDPFHVLDDELKDIKVLKTFMGGQCTYEG